MANRNLMADFQAFIDKELPKGDYVLAVEAHRIVEKLEKQDKALLTGWLLLNAEQHVAGFLREQQRYQRMLARRDAPKAAFQTAAERHAAGDKKALEPFALHLVVDAHNTRRAIGDMTSEDHLFVAARYESRSWRSAFLAQFHRDIAAKIPDGKVTRDVFSEEDYVRLQP